MFAKIVLINLVAAALFGAMIGEGVIGEDSSTHHPHVVETAAEAPREAAGRKWGDF